MKRLLVIFMLLSLLLTFTACDQTKNADSDDDDVSTSENGDAEENDNTEEGGDNHVATPYDDALNAYYDVHLLGDGSKLAAILPDAAWTSLGVTPEQAATGAGTYITINWYNCVGTGDMSYSYKVSDVETVEDTAFALSTLSQYGLDSVADNVYTMTVDVTLTGVRGTHNMTDYHTVYEIDGTYYVLSAFETAQFCASYASI